MASTALTPIPDKPEFDIFFLADSISFLRVEKEKHDSLLFAMNEEIKVLRNDLTVCQQFAIKIQELEIRLSDVDAKAAIEKEQFQAFKKETTDAAAAHAAKILSLEEQEGPADLTSDLAELKKGIEKYERDRRTDRQKQEEQLQSQLEKIKASKKKQERFEALVGENMKVLRRQSYALHTPYLRIPPCCIFR
jgi:hypothetical protein